MVPTVLLGARGRLANRFFDLGAVKFGAFILKKDRGNPNAVPSPHYFDCRCESHPSKPGPIPREMVGFVGAHMLDLLDDAVIRRIKAVAAVPHGATPYAEVIAAVLGVPLMRLTKRENADGTTVIDGIDGNEADFLGTYALLVEDVVTTAASSVEAINVLSRKGVLIDHVLSVVDREQGGSKYLRSMDIELHSLLTYTGLVNHYRACDMIDQATFDRSRAYHLASS